MGLVGDLDEAIHEVITSLFALSRPSSSDEALTGIYEVAMYDSSACFDLESRVANCRLEEILISTL